MPSFCAWRASYCGELCIAMALDIVPGAKKTTLLSAAKQLRAKKRGGVADICMAARLLVA